MDAVGKFGPDHEVKEFCQVVLDDLGDRLFDGIKFLLRRVMERAPSSSSISPRKPVPIEVVRTMPECDQPVDKASLKDHHKVRLVCGHAT